MYVTYSILAYAYPRALIAIIYAHVCRPLYCLCFCLSCCLFDEKRCSLKLPKLLLQFCYEKILSKQKF